MILLLFLRKSINESSIRIKSFRLLKIKDTMIAVDLSFEELIQKNLLLLLLKLMKIYIKYKNHQLNKEHYQIIKIKSSTCNLYLKSIKRNPQILSKPMLKLIETDQSLPSPITLQLMSHKFKSCLQVKRQKNPKKPLQPQAKQRENH